MYKSKYDENDFKINLFNAIYNEDIKKVKELVNNKMAVSNEFAAIPLNEHDDTPLHIASILGKENIVNILLKAGANPDDVNCEDDFYKLAKECRNGKFSSIDKFSFEKLIEFIDWKASIKLSDTNYNIDVVKLHLQDARNLKSFLETGKKELTEEQKEKLEQKLDKLNDMIPFFYG
ncbi:ankyrin repeat domain-containing protein [Rickettsia tamurae]|uniref:ankyrin repeat domain-containing protein n=1 Tax=Rickettsia tamurae TaxID=334545 RepID=UPI000A8787A9|nr:ankyrin repeat domain-containing protein [Rickettsia tamurae]